MVSGGRWQNCWDIVAIDVRYYGVAGWPDGKSWAGWEGEQKEVVILTEF